MATKPAVVTAPLQTMSTSGITLNKGQSFDVLALTLIDSSSNKNDNGNQFDVAAINQALLQENIIASVTFDASTQMATYTMTGATTKNAIINVSLKRTVANADTCQWWYTLTQAPGKWIGSQIWSIQDLSFIKF